MCEQSRATDAAALRREARRRKILENSTNRLKLIEGVESGARNSPAEDRGPLRPPSPPPPFADGTTGAPTSADHHQVPQGRQTVPQTDAQSQLKDLLKGNEDLKRISDFFTERTRRKNEAYEDSDEEKEDVGDQDQDLDLDLDARTVTDDRKGTVTPFHVLYKKKLHYVLLAFLVNALLYFNLGSFFYENLFCPFYTVKLMELMLMKREKEQETQMQPFLFLLLAGLPQGVVKSTTLVLRVFSALFSDLLLYMFTCLVGIKILNLQVQ